MSANLLGALSGFHNQQLESMYGSGGGAASNETALVLREKRAKAEKIKAFGSDMLDLVSENPNPTPKEVIGLVSKHGLEMSDATQALGFLKESKALDAARLKATEEADKVAGLKDTGPIVPSMDYYVSHKDEAGHVIDWEKKTDYNVASKDQIAREGWLKQQGYRTSKGPIWEPDKIETKTTRKVDFWDSSGKKISRLVPNAKFDETVDQYIGKGYSLEDPKKSADETLSGEKLRHIKLMITKGPDMGYNPITAQNVRRAFGLDKDRFSDAMQIVMSDPASGLLNEQQLSDAVIKRARILREADRGGSGAALSFEETVKAEYPDAYQSEDGKWYIKKDGETFLIEEE